jgi:hypothetical protein
MSRGHVRHFVGNRDRLLLDTARAFYADENGRPAILPAAVDSLDGALDYLFGTEFAASSSENAIVLAFVELARSTPEIAEVLAAAYSSTRERLAAYIAEAKHDAPDAARARRGRRAARGTVATPPVPRRRPSPTRRTPATQPDPRRRKAGFACLPGPTHAFSASRRGRAVAGGPRSRRRPPPSARRARR